MKKVLAGHVRKDHIRLLVSVPPHLSTLLKLVSRQQKPARPRAMRAFYMGEYSLSNPNYLVAVGIFRITIFVLVNIYGPHKYIYDVAAVCFILYIAVAKVFKIETHLVCNIEWLLNLFSGYVVRLRGISG